MSHFPSSHLIYHPILANNGQQVVQPQQQHALVNQQLLHKPIHVKVLVFEALKTDLSSERMETLKPISIRRGERVLPNFAELTNYLTEKCGLNLAGALIRYQDDEGHYVDMNSDEELAYGLQLCRDSRTSANRPVFRIAVLLLKKEEENSVPKQPEERQCPWRGGRRHGGCPFRGGRRNLPENHPHCPFLFRKNHEGENVLEVDIDVDKLKNGLDVGKFVKENINNVQVPHFGVTCDGCGKYAFVGKRFKCDDCDDFDFCEDCFGSEAIRGAHFGGSHSFQEKEARSACFLRNIFGVNNCNKEEEKKEEEIVVDNQLYGEPVAVEEPAIVEAQPVVVEEPVVVPVSQVQHPLNPFQQVIVEQPIVQQEQPVVVEQPNVFQTEISLLRDMGFVDEVSNLHLLKKYNGDLQRVIVDLIH